MRTAIFLSGAHTLHLETLVADDEAITVMVTTRGTTTRYLDCGKPSAQLHNRKRRRFAELPQQGLPVCLDLQPRHLPTSSVSTG